MTLNQKISVAAIIAFVVSVFLSPIVAYDHKVSDCIQSFARLGSINDGMRLVCIEIVNGSKR